MVKATGGIVLMHTLLPRSACRLFLGMPQQACTREPGSQQTTIQVDLSCSESGEDLSNSFDSPCWTFAERDTNRISARAYTPPIAMEVGRWKLHLPKNVQAFLFAQHSLHTFTW
jgi:hypothetical protein